MESTLQLVTPRQADFAWVHPSTGETIVYAAGEPCVIRPDPGFRLAKSLKYKPSGEVFSVPVPIPVGQFRLAIKATLAQRGVDTGSERQGVSFQDLELVDAESDADLLARVRDVHVKQTKLDPSQFVTVKAADVQAMPRRWRQAWAFNGAALSVDMTKARVIRKRELTKLRKDFLAIVQDKLDTADAKGDAAGKKDKADKKKVALLFDVDAWLASKTAPADLDALPAELS